VAALPRQHQRREGVPTSGIQLPGGSRPTVSLDIIRRVKWPSDSGHLSIVDQKPVERAHQCDFK